MAKSLALIIITALLVGCAASKSKIKKNIDPWIGQNINSLILKWGAPTTVYKLPSGEMTTYTWIYRGGSYITPYLYAGATYVQSYCRFDWTANGQNIIISYRSEGECVIKK